eukprot:9733924-Ditylum_brightwellii.AAC.1
MPIAFDCFWHTLAFVMPSAMLLLVVIGVAGWGWPISSKSILNGMASLPFLYSPLHSTSAVEAMTHFKTFARTNTGPL